MARAPKAAEAASKTATKTAIAVYELHILDQIVEPKQSFTAETSLVEALIADGNAVEPGDNPAPAHVDAIPPELSGEDQVTHDPAP